MKLKEGTHFSPAKLQLVLAASVLALATSNARPGTAQPASCWLKDDGCRIYIGKRLWVFIPAGNSNVVEVTFTQHDWTTSRTLKLKSGSSFVVTGLAKAS